MDRSFRDVFLLMRKRLWLIVAVIVLTVVATAILSFYIIQPKYHATSQFIVNNDLEQQQLTDVNINNIRTNVELINTYIVVIKSPAVLDKVIEELGLSLETDELASMVDVSSEESSQVVAVTVTNSNQQMAADIANAMVNVFKEEIAYLMKVDNVRTLSTAKVDTTPTPVNLNPTLNMAIGVFLGMILGVAIALLKEYMDLSVRTKRDLEESIDIPVVGVISTIDEKLLPSREMEKTATSRHEMKGERLHVVKKK